MTVLFVILGKSGFMIYEFFGKSTFNFSSPSTEDKPMGLVVLIQATSVIGHRRRYGEPERATLPTCDDERDLLRKDDTLSAEFDRRVEELDRHFDQVSINNNETLIWDLIKVKKYRPLICQENGNFLV